ncbi:MAG: glycosyltransferase family 2 protein [Deltaproteobacteria bacterium]|nr:glycosyltransferase family 2 protein [Deltaproteobacteria bacterium]
MGDTSMTIDALRLARLTLRGIAEGDRGQLSALRRALLSRVRTTLGLGELRSLAAQLDAQAAQLDAQGAQLDALAARLLEQSTRLEEQSARLHAQSSLLEAQSARLAHTEGRAAILDQLWRTERWLSAARVPDTLVSVILPTRDRAGWLTRAIASVQAQSHPRWELIIVDDGSTDETPRVLAAQADPRIRSFRLGGTGHAAARNHGLAQARGTLIAYLDDDNALYPHWLRAVAWALHTRPDLDVVYGVRIHERAPWAGVDPADPLVQFVAPFDRERLKRECFMDMGTIGHRAGLAEARFDTSLTAGVDWDLALRLTRDKPAYPVAVPAVAYTIDAPRRVTHEARSPEMYQRVRERHSA